MHLIVSDSLWHGLLFLHHWSGVSSGTVKNITNLNHKIRLKGIKAISVFHFCYRFDSALNMQKIKNENNFKVKFSIN